MKYINEFRDSALVNNIAGAISREVRPHFHYKFMEFCGGHTHAIYRYGLLAFLPKNVELVHGPGCPVCVLPISRLDQAIYLALQSDVIFCSYGDMLRVPASNQMSLLKAKARGADVRMVYSIDDAVTIAQTNPDKKVIFFAIGFETTTPPTAVALQNAQQLNLQNFFVFCNHVLTPPALRIILEIQEENSLNGIIGPAHVSVVIGSEAYVSVCQQYRIPIVIAGFEPLDVLHTILMLVKQVNQGQSYIENQYARAVTSKGNQTAQAAMKEVFELRDSFEWRGLGEIPESACKINQAYSQFDVEKQFELPDVSSDKNSGCECGKVLCGLIKPTECPAFGKGCSPDNPMGACMVSSEGACAAIYGHRGFL